MLEKAIFSELEIPRELIKLSDLKNKCGYRKSTVLDYAAMFRI